MNPSILTPPSSHHGASPWDLALSVTLGFLGLVALIQCIALGSVLITRMLTGNTFDPIVFSEFEAQKYSVSPKTLPPQLPETLQTLPPSPIQDRVTSTVEQVSEERKQMLLKEQTTQLIRKEKEIQAATWIEQAEAAYHNQSHATAIGHLMNALEIAPDYLPALQLLAQIYEENHQPLRARFYWEKAAGIARPGSPEFLEIERHLTRIEAGKLSILDVRKEDLPRDDLFDLRLRFEITIGLKGSAAVTNSEQTRVDVFFYDQYINAHGTAIPVKVQSIPLQPARSWVEGLEQTLIVKYSIPKGHYRFHSAKYGPTYTYGGVLVRVYQAGILQDTFSSLPSLLAGLESPATDHAVTLP